MDLQLFTMIKRSLIKHEERKTYPYIDTENKITIGIGYNLSDRGMPQKWIDDTFSSDVSYLYENLKSTFPFFETLNDARKAVLVDMGFMGFKKLLSFKKMFDALKNENFNTAAIEMLDSKWAAQVKQRATDLAEAMKNGVYDV